MIPGDGVGPEMMDSVQDVLKAIGAPIDFEVHHLSEVGTLQSDPDFCSIHMYKNMYLHTRIKDG